MKKLKLFALALMATFSMSAMADLADLNYAGGSALPTGYTYYGSSTGVANPDAFSVIDLTVGEETFNVFDVTAGGGGTYNKRAIEFTLTEDCSVTIDLYTGNPGRVFSMYNGSSTAVETLDLAAKNTKYTFTYNFTGATAEEPQTYSFSGSGSKVYIASITFEASGSSDCIEADAEFDADETDLAIEEGEEEVSTNLTFTAGDNTSTEAYTVLKDGKA
ncbi:MAG: hypothetical protein IJ609_01255, partial [Paludibacteraceae bacterium]|nr:hypothetical protein [Paludibacteraceae bacterium]